MPKFRGHPVPCQLIDTVSAIQVLTADSIDVRNKAGSHDEIVT